MAIQYIDGRRLQRTILAGLQRVINHQDHLNRINVFPVPDSDTGTNMAYLLVTIQDRIDRDGHIQVNQMSQKIADSALDGARGNSGAILAQFLVGFADAIQDQVRLSTQQFSQAVRTACHYAYEALVEPREGTILTVIKDWADSIHRHCDHVHDFGELLRNGLERAQHSLKETPKKLNVLAKAGVVDAGAQGFVYLLEGIQDFIHKGVLSGLPIQPSRSGNLLAKPAFEEKFRYCTECIVTGTGINRRAFQERLLPLGDSIVLAGTKTKCKVHIHTAAPQTVFQLCRTFGSVTGEKTDDMWRQQQDAHTPQGDFALLVDSTCDLPEKILEELNIHVIPVRLNFGDLHHVDKVTLSTPEFWELIHTHPTHPQTSQPTPGDFRRQYQFLSSHYKSIFSLHLTARKSGTFQSALTAAKTLPGRPVEVLDTVNLSIGFGLIAMRVAEALKAGKTKTGILAVIKQAIAATTIYIGLDSLDFAVRGGRVPGYKKTLAEVLRINPILSLDSEGELVNIGQTFGSGDKPEKLKRFVMRRLDPGRRYRVGLAYTNNQATVTSLAAEFSHLVGPENVIVTEVGPALGVHAGPGALAIATQLMEDVQ